jgi:hypothetical protein
MVTLGDVQAFADSLTGKPSSRARTLAAVKSLLSFGQRTGYLPLNVGAAVKLPRRKDTLAERILTEPDVVRMLALQPNQAGVLSDLEAPGRRQACGQGSEQPGLVRQHFPVPALDYGTCQRFDPRVVVLCWSATSQVFRAQGRIGRWSQANIVKLEERPVDQAIARIVVCFHSQRATPAVAGRGCARGAGRR